MRKLINKLRKWFYTGIKETVWHNVRHEYESAESGVWYTYGDANLYKYTYLNLYVLGLRVWVFSRTVENLGPYDDTELGGKTRKIDLNKK